MTEEKRRRRPPLWGASDASEGSVNVDPAKLEGIVSEAIKKSLPKHGKDNYGGALGGILKKISQPDASDDTESDSEKPYEFVPPLLRRE